MTTTAVLPSCPFSSTCVTPGISLRTHPEGEPCMYIYCIYYYCNIYQVYITAAVYLVLQYIVPDIWYLVYNIIRLQFAMLKFVMVIALDGMHSSAVLSLFCLCFCEVAVGVGGRIPRWGRIQMTQAERTRTIKYVRVIKHEKLPKVVSREPLHIGLQKLEAQTTLTHHWLCEKKTYTKNSNLFFSPTRSRRDIRKNPKVPTFDT